MAVTHEQIMGRLAAVDSHTQASLAYLGGLINQLNALESRMSELDQSVEALQQSVTDLGARIGELPRQLADALTRIGELNSQIADLQADDDADAAQIEALTAERDGLLADSQENVAKIQSETDQINALGQPATPEEPPADPAPEA
jgi:chromosome segregation ATPase